MAFKLVTKSVVLLGRFSPFTVNDDALRGAEVVGEHLVLDQNNMVVAKPIAVLPYDLLDILVTDDRAQFRSPAKGLTLAELALAAKKFTRFQSDLNVAKYGLNIEYSTPSRRTDPTNFLSKTSIKRLNLESPLHEADVFFISKYQEMILRIAVVLVAGQPERYVKLNFEGDYSDNEFARVIENAKEIEYYARNIASRTVSILKQ